VGEKQVGSGADIHMTLVQQAMLSGQPRSMLAPPPVTWKGVLQNKPERDEETTDVSLVPPQTANAIRELASVAEEVERAMAGLIEDQLIVVRRHVLWVEVEIRTDILFTSGVAQLAPPAVAVLEQLAAALKPFPNPIRVEGHTDNVPISTAAFPSNWELSSARAASVVHLFTKAGLDPARLAVIGLGEFRPAQPNTTPQGRGANRRVLLIILSTDAPPEGTYAEDRGKQEPEAEPVTTRTQMDALGVSAVMAHGEMTE
jgi:chemotaxis protein MotB